MNWDAEKEKLEKLLERIQDLNSSYPATKEFLAARGLTHVNQLDRRGTQDLIAHLQKTYQALLH